VKKGNAPLLPNERDEAADRQVAGPRKKNETGFDRPGQRPGRYRLARTARRGKSRPAQQETPQMTSPACSPYFFGAAGSAAAAGAGSNFVIT
jgi:hypothetical protein